MKKANAALSLRSGCEPVYPGSHELRPVFLVPVEHALAPEGMLVVASLEEKTHEEAPDPVSAFDPERSVEQLYAMAFTILRQVKSATEVLASIGHPIPRTRSIERRDQLVEALLRLS